MCVCVCKFIRASQQALEFVYFFSYEKTHVRSLSLERIHMIFNHDGVQALVHGHFTEFF